jgi:hypothetical protein
MILSEQTVAHLPLGHSLSVGHGNNRCRITKMHNGWLFEEGDMPSVMAYSEAQAAAEYRKRMEIYKNTEQRLA